MAESVEKSLEDMLPELEQMERVGLFTNKQIRKILMKRKNFEYKLKRMTKVKEDFINYIQYETNLLALVWKRRKEIHYHLKKVEIDYKIEARIHKLFRLAHLRFNEDTKLWLSHIAFCKQRKQTKTASKLFTTMLKIHNKKPDLWVYAAKFEFEGNANPDTARSLLQRGLRFNPNSKKLWQEYFRFELLYAEKMRKRHEVLQHRQDSDDVNDTVLQGKVASAVYDQAKQALPDDVQFIVSFLPICQKFDFAMGIEENIFKDLKDGYPNTSVCWDALARRRLDRKEGTFTDGKNAEREFHAVFEEGVQAAPTDETWSLYLTGCFQLITQAKTEKVKNKRNQRTLLVLEEAKSAGHLTPPFWIKWIDLLLSMDMAEKALNVAMDSTKVHPTAIDLWQKLLNLYIPCDVGFDKLQEILRAAEKHIPKKDMWPIIQTVLEYSISSLERDSTVKMLESCLNDCFEVSSQAKEIYLDYQYLLSGLEDARKMYSRISQSPPNPVSFYNKYINIEECQIKPKVKFIRRAFEDATLHHGKTNPDIWMNYIKAETKYGKPEKVGSINMRAIKTLEGHHNEEFVTQFTLMQNSGRI